MEYKSRLCKVALT